MAKSEDYPGKKPASLIRGLPHPSELAEPNLEISISQMLANQKAESLLKTATDGLNSPANISSEVTKGEQTVVLTGELMPRRGYIADLPISSISISPFQPRKEFLEQPIEDLANSISAVGLAKPITVRVLSEGVYQLIGGERRWRAHKILGRETITAYVIIASDAQAKILALTDNEGQETLSEYERGCSYRSIMESGDEPSLRSLARRIGVNHSTVSRCLLLLELPKAVTEILDKKPRLIGGKSAKTFIELGKTNEPLLLTAVESMRDGKWTQEQALRWLKQEVAKLHPQIKSGPTLKTYSGLGTVKIEGKKIELRCDKDVDTQRLSALFEEFLSKIDPELIKG